VKRFVLAFDSGVIVIRHWKTHNVVRKDRYHPTIYQAEKASLYLEADGTYTDQPAPGTTPCISAAPDTEDAAPLAPDTEDATPLASDIDSETGEDLDNEQGEVPDVETEDGAGCLLVDDLTTKRVPRLGKVRSGKGRSGKGKNNNFSGGGGSSGRTAAEREVTDFLQSRGKDPEAYFGMTPEIRRGVELLTRAAFKRFAARPPTEDDLANAFLCLYHSEEDLETGEWSMDLPKDSRDLLLYAFEKASEAGRPADWRYIDGVLNKLHQRGITTLVQAEDYDYERNVG